MNPALAQLNAQRLPQLLQQARTTIDGLRSLGDPNKALSYLMKQNPNMRQALEYVNANGGDPRQAFNKLAGEMGIDPSSLNF